MSSKPPNKINLSTIMKKPVESTPPTEAESARDVMKSLQSSERDTDRNRVRIELTEKKAIWLLGVITTEIKKMTIDDDEFSQTYMLYNSLKRQLELMKNKS